jgi:hypothetical protein
MRGRGGGVGRMGRERVRGWACRWSRSRRGESVPVDGYVSNATRPTSHAHHCAVDLDVAAISASASIGHCGIPVQESRGGG